MIKYIELTAPEASAFRQAKILSIECQEGDHIKQGDTLFMVQSGSQEIALPATRDGKICELIAVQDENITLSTALLLLETEVTSSSEKKPLKETSENVEEAKKTSKTASETTTKKTTKKKKSKKVSSSSSKKKAKKKTKKKTKKRAKKKTKSVKDHKQQSLDLQIDDDSIASDQENHALTDTKQEDSESMPSDATIEIHVPDIGGDTAKVIEILVSPGDQIEEEQALVTLESDKASMDVPSTVSGIVSSIEVSIDDDVGEGTLIAKIETSSSSQDATEQVSAEEDKPEPQEPSTLAAAEAAEQGSAKATTEAVIDVLVPDIGGDAAKVIEFLVSVGDEVTAEDSLLTLESDKASMDVPCPADGTIASIEVEIDQEVSEGVLIATLSTSATGTGAEQKSSEAPATSPDKAVKQTQEKAALPASAATAPSQNANPAAVSAEKSHASPSIRRFGRELGVDLSKVSGSGRKGRILKEDVKAFVKGVMTSSGSAGQADSGAGIPAVPAQDFTKYGEVDVQPLNKIKRLTATNLHRSWLNVPHVTHNDEANISELEAFRKKVNQGVKDSGNGVKVSPLAFIVKAIVGGLKTYPQFNSSLEPGGENLIYKKYFNVGIAVDTPNGLVVPVIKDADSKSVSQVANEMGELAAKARDGKLSIADMSGACITISSLGGIGGTNFTPIVNAPEVAILGVSRSKMQPVWNGQEFEPGMILPLSLSYDHRVIDGAEAARFTRHIAEVLEDVRLLSIQLRK